MSSSPPSVSYNPLLILVVSMLRRKELVCLSDSLYSCKYLQAKTINYYNRTKPMQPKLYSYIIYFLTYYHNILQWMELGKLTGPSRQLYLKSLSLEPVVHYWVGWFPREATVTTGAGAGAPRTYRGDIKPTCPKTSELHFLPLNNLNTYKVTPYPYFVIPNDTQNK